MSIIYSKEFLQSLAQRPGASVPTGNVEDLRAFEVRNAQLLARRLAVSLTNDIPIPGYDFSVSTANPGTQLETSSLENISVFIRWLNANKISLFGNRIVYSEDEFAPLKENLSSKYIPVNTRGERQQNRQFTVDGFWVEPNALKAYIEKLQKYAQEQKKNDPGFQVMEVMLGRIIDEANRTYGFNLSATPAQKPPGKDGLDENTIVDPKITNVLHSNLNVTQGAVKPIALKDLKDIGALNDYLNKEKSTIVVLRRDIQGKPTDIQYEIKDKEFICLALNVLKDRAAIAVRIAGSQEQKYAQAYQQRVNVLQAATGCAGKDIKETQTKPSDSAAYTDNKGTQAQQQKDLSEALQATLYGLPLTNGQMDFNRVESWIERAKTFASKLQRNNSKMNSYVSSFDGFVRKYEDMSMAIFRDFPELRDAKLINYSDSAEQIIQALGITPGKLIDLVKRLQTLTTVISGAVQALYTPILGTESVSDSDERSIKNQLANGPGGNTYNYNMSTSLPYLARKADSARIRRI